MISPKRITYFVVGLCLAVGYSDTLSAQNRQLTTTPNNFVFNVQPGFIPSPQTLHLGTSDSQTVSYSIQVATSGGGNWLLYSQGTGNTPSEVIISANSAALASGTYSGVITINAQNVTNTPLSLTVTLNVGNQLSATPSRVNFAYQTGGATPSPATLAINSTGSGTVPYLASAQTNAGGNWLLVNPTTGNTPGNLTIGVNAAGLQAGTYDGVVHLTSTAGGTSPLDIPVQLTVSASPTLSYTPASGLSFAYQTGTTPPAPKTLTFSTNGAPISFLLTPMAVTGGNWLVLNTFSGLASQNQPQPVSVSVDTTGLLPGTYTANIAVSAPGTSNSSFNVPVTLLVSTKPLLILGGPPQPFNFQIGGNALDPQIVSLASSSTALPFTVTTETGGSNWLSVTPSSGTTPGTLTLTANAQLLAPGQYAGIVTVMSANAGNSPQSFPVTLNVSTSTMLNASAGSLTFNYQTTIGQTPAAQIVNVTSTGAPLNYTATLANNSCTGSWLALLPASGTTPGAFTVAVNPNAVTPVQSCTANIQISASGATNTVTIPVALNVSANPLLNITPGQLQFSAPAGGNTIPQPQLISLSSTDTNTTIPFNVNVSTTTGGTWLFAGSTNGATPSNISVTVNPTGLQPGTYQGTITVTSANLPAAKVIPVTLIVTSNVNVAVAPSSVSFELPANATASATQVVQLNPSVNQPLTFSATVSVQQGTNWLSVTPAGGTAPGSITIAASAAGLSQGTYNGQVTVVIPGAANTPITIPVSLTVGPASGIGVGTPTLTFSSTVGSTTNPATQSFQVTSPGAPVTFTVEVASTSCGNFLSATPPSTTTPATVTVGVNVSNLPQGTCQGTVSLKAPGLPTQTVGVTLNIGPAVAPQITAVVNAASYGFGAVAPGEVVTIYGTNIGPADLTTYSLNNGQFATQVAGTEVLFDNIAAPVIYVSATQTSVVVPFEIAGRPTTNIQVRRNGQTSQGLVQQVIQYAPGIFTTNSQGTGQGAIVNQNGTINGPANPAPKGSVIALYITGAGLISTNPASGSVVPASPLPTINAPVTASIGGNPAHVEYMGAAPGAIAGLYQINVTVPNLTYGPNPQTLTLTVGGQPAQSTVTLYIQ